jgi:hypothetical protein
MKRTIIITLIITFLIAVFIWPMILDVLFSFVFLGLIPGTTLSIPPVLMMLLYPIAVLLAIRWLARQPMYFGSKAKQEQTARALARKRITKKTATAPRRQRKPARA